MCRIIAEEHGKLNPSLTDFTRGGSPSLSSVVIKRIGKLYDMIKEGAEMEIVVTTDDQTYVQVNDEGGVMLLVEHFTHVFAFGDKTQLGQVALLDLIDSLMGDIDGDEQWEQFDNAKELVKNSTAYCISLKFKK